MKKAAPKSGFFDTLEAISSKRPKQRRKRPEQQRRKQRKRLRQQRKRLQQRRKQLRKRLRKRQQKLALPSYRKRPGPWRRSAKPAGATFSCLCPQKGCQKSVVLELYSKPETRLRGTRAEDASQLALLHIQTSIIRCMGLFPIGPRWCTASPRLSVVNRRQNQLARWPERLGPWSIAPPLSRNRACECPPCRALDRAK